MCVENFFLPLRVVHYRFQPNCGLCFGAIFLTPRILSQICKPAFFITSLDCTNNLNPSFLAKANFFCTLARILNLPFNPPCPHRTDRLGSSKESSQDDPAVMCSTLRTSCASFWSCVTLLSQMQLAPTQGIGPFI